MKNEEILKIEDLVDGEIYAEMIGDSLYITQNKSKGNSGYYICTKDKLFNSGGASIKINKELRIATNQEKHHLNESITSGKFIDYETAMKTFKEISSFYITYHTGFTEDLFNEFFKWAKTNIGDYTRDSIPISYKDFKNDRYDYIWVNLSEKDCFYSQDNNSQLASQEYNLDQLKQLISYKEQKEELKEFPSEGCVYDSVEKLDNLVKYLLNRPLNRTDGKVQKSEAIGIAWNRTSCWWLKTKKSEKTQFKLSDLKHFLSNTKKIEFKERDYIILLQGKSNDAFKLNYCYKQKYTNSYLTVEKDYNEVSNGWSLHPFDKCKDNDWRYATEQEIQHYNYKGKPYDVTTLYEKEELPEYVKCIRQERSNEYTVGKIYKVENQGVRTNQGYLRRHSLPKNLLNHYDNTDFIPSTKEDFDKQGLLKELIKELSMKEEKEEWVPKVNDWIIVTNSTKNYNAIQLEFIGQVESYKSNSNYWIKNHNVIKYETYKNICCDSLPFRKALPHEIPNNQNDQEIDIGDEVKTCDGNGIVIGITTYNSYLVKGAMKLHKGDACEYIKGGPSDKDDSYFYSKNLVYLVKKANLVKSITISTITTDFTGSISIGKFSNNTNVPSTKEILKFEIYDQKPSIKKEEFIELNINLTKNIKKPIKL
jgi:hypothetical protein